MFLLRVAEVAKCLFGEPVQPAGGHVLLQLSVPHPGVELKEPGPKRGEFLKREAAHRFLDFA
jgi:hypothetical protein